MKMFDKSARGDQTRISKVQFLHMVQKTAVEVGYPRPGHIVESMAQRWELMPILYRAGVVLAWDFTDSQKILYAKDADQKWDRFVEENNLSIERGILFAEIPLNQKGIE